jgi:dienelactone hydrolase
VSDLYLSPTFYGIEDVSIAATTGASFEARVYFPTDVDYSQPAVLRPGRYDLVVFAHGARGPGTPGEGLCPEDWSHDHQLWEEVLHRLARCGYVVVAPELSSVGGRIEPSIDRIAATVAWMRRDWTHALSLSWGDMVQATMGVASSEPPPGGSEQTAIRVAPREKSTAARSILWGGKLIDTGQLMLNPTGTALVGHSWGARACAIAIKRGRVPARVFAAIAGTFDDNDSPAAVASSGLPSLLIAGDQDNEAFSYVRGLWNSTKEPKHQAVIQGVDHWDWFNGYGIRPCDLSAPRPKCIAAFMAASELILGLLTKYLANRPFPPHLIGPTGSRPPLLPWFDTRKRCAMVVRWVDPSGGGDGSHCVVGHQMFGEWEDEGPSW